MTLMCETRHQGAAGQVATPCKRKDVGMSGLRYDVFQTGVGWVGALASPQGLRATTLPAAAMDEALAALGPEADLAERDPGALRPARAAVLAALGGRQSGRAVPLDLEGAPPFFRAAWEACRRIPFGETRSYGWLAAAAGRPGAARAAGQAMARNPLPLVVPCHRVVAADGSLHGYGGGLPLKARLLASEGAGVPLAEKGRGRAGGRHAGV